MNRVYVALSFLTILSAASFAEIDEYVHYSGYLKEGYLSGYSRIPNYDGEYFNHPCPSCGTFESQAEAFCVSRPQWDDQGNNYMDCDMTLEIYNGSSWVTFATAASVYNEETIICGTSCQDKYVRVSVYDYYGANSGVVGVRFGKGHD